MIPGRAQENAAKADNHDDGQDERIQRQLQCGMNGGEESGCGESSITVHMRHSLQKNGRYRLGTEQKQKSSDYS